MKSTTKKLLTLAVSVQLLAGSAFAAVFQDTHGHWAQAEITRLSDANIIGGYPDGSFHPEGLITRAEFSAILAKALGLNASYGGSSFVDVSSSHWAAASIEAVRAAGLVSGYPGGRFMPNKNISRAEALAMLAKAQNTMPEPDFNQANALIGQFYDGNQVPGWARPAVAETIQTGVFKNKPSSPGAIEPNRMVTRGEVAAMVAALQGGGTPNNYANNNTNYNTGSQYNTNTGAQLTGRIAVVPANTEFTGTLTTNISSETARVGDQVVLTVDQALASQNNLVAVPVGSRIFGRVTAAEPAGRLSDSGQLDIDFTELVLPNGERVMLTAQVATEDGLLRGDTTKGRILKAVGKTALGAGLGAAIGAGLGPLSGGSVGKGAIYGTAIGAAGGLATAAVQKGKEVELSAGDRLEIKLQAPLSVTVGQ